MTPRRSLIFDTTTRLLFDATLVLSAYLLFAGHNQPGGGFVGGLVASAAVALRYIAGGIDEVRSLVNVQPWTFLAAGLALAVVTALVPLALGDGPLNQDAYEIQLQLLGKIKATTATAFDTGGYLIVIGLVLMIFEGLGDERTEPADLAEADDPTSDGEGTR